MMTRFPRSAFVFFMTFKINGKMLMLLVLINEILMNSVQFLGIQISTVHGTVSNMAGIWVVLICTHNYDYREIHVKTIFTQTMLPLY